MEVSPSIPFPHFFLFSSQCIKCIILSHLTLPSRTAPRSHTQTHTGANTQRAGTAAPRKRDKELATPKGPASVTPLPRLDHMAAGEERSERTERGGVETRVGGGEKETSGAKKKGRKCDKDAEDGEMKEEERQMGPGRRQRDTESLKKKKGASEQQCQ